MMTTPKSIRLQIGIFGRTNVGKSSLLNMIAGQDVSMISEIPGTTTDVVEKAYELLPIGPVTFLDTAGIDDISLLSGKRIERTKKVLDRADIALIVTENGIWSEFEEELVLSFEEKKIPFLIIVNKNDIIAAESGFLNSIIKENRIVLSISSTDSQKRDININKIKEAIFEILPEEFVNQPPLLGDLIPAGGLCIMVIPIDLQAPKGRLILPQVQAIRDTLDNDAAVLCVKEREYSNMLLKIGFEPDLVICDSQIVMKMTADTPKNIKCTTFSILFSRFKGDLTEESRGAAAIEHLKTGDKILVAEACSHHSLEDDIGRVKIPRWLRQYAGADIQIDHVCGRDYPANISEYKLIIHCGSCMLTRREKLIRIEKAKSAGVPITNYGIAISLMQGVLERVLSPFPAALDAYLTAKNI